jgi:hypothetical protein
LQAGANNAISIPGEAFATRIKQSKILITFKKGYGNPIHGQSGLKNQSGAK